MKIMIVEDDYITKPYQGPILLARIADVLKRTQKSQIKEITQIIYKEIRYLDK